MKDAMKLSDKFSMIYDLVDVDNKDAIVREIRALKNFTEEELSRIFGNSNILWILENYTVKELKDAVKRVEDSIKVEVGDIISFKDDDTESVIGVVLFISGNASDRCTALCFHNNSGYYKIQEGISTSDIVVVKNSGSDTFTAVINTLKSGEDNSIVKEGDL